MGLAHAVLPVALARPRLRHTAPYREYVWSKRKPRDSASGIVFPGVQQTTWIDAVPFLIEEKGKKEPMGPEQYGYLTDFRRFLLWWRVDAMLLGEANVEPREAAYVADCRPCSRAIAAE